MLGGLVACLPRPFTPSLAAAGVSAIIGLSAYSYGFHKGHLQSEREYATQALRASEAARAIERQWQAQLQQAQNEARIRENKIQADVATVRAERDRLRKQLAANHSKLPSIPRTAVTQYAVTIGDVFEQCAKRLEEVARAADGHSEDVLTLKRIYTIKGHTPRSQ